jgi:flagellar basal-body rod protein FlgC
MQNAEWKTGLVFHSAFCILHFFSYARRRYNRYSRHESHDSAIRDPYQSLCGGLARPGGVQTVGVVDDMSPFHRIHNPAHPDADKDGYVNMPNVDLPVEMVNMITASRAYEANLRAMQFFRQMTEQSHSLLRNQAG